MSWSVSDTAPSLAPRTGTRNVHGRTASAPSVRSRWRHKQQQQRVRATSASLSRLTQPPSFGTTLQHRLVKCGAANTETVARAGERKGQQLLDLDAIRELAPGSAALTYLENNGWLLTLDGVSFLVDPVLEGPLDFGIPWLYSAFKYRLRNLTVEDVLLVPDCVLLTQSLDDHCHKKTLTKLASLRPDVLIVATPNAQPFLSTLFQNVIYLEPGQSTQVQGRHGMGLSPSTSSSSCCASVTATPGPVLGPPWQRPENGYIVRGKTQGSISLYLEPHCGFDQEFLKAQEEVDVVITPVVQQLLPAFTLVSGQADAVKLVKALRARCVVPMANGDMEASGILSALVRSEGTVSSFEALLKGEGLDVEVREPVPGRPLIFLNASNKS